MRGMFGAVVVGAVLSMGLAGSASAQARGAVTLGGGVNMPIGNFKDAVKLGWLGQVTGGVSFGDGMLGVRVDGTYGQNSEKGTGGGKFKILSAMGDVVVSPKVQGNVGPYILAGAGFANGKDGSSETKFAWNAGAGVHAGAGKVGFYVEARFLQVRHSDGSSNMIPITAGVRISAGK